MKEDKFIQELKKRADQQKSLRENIPLPELFSFIASSLGNHPWRVLIPISVAISFFVYFIFGNKYIEIVLWVFRLFKQ